MADAWRCADDGLKLLAEQTNEGASKEVRSALVTWGAVTCRDSGRACAL